MSTLNLLKLYKIFGCKEDGELTDSALASLQEWGLVPREGTYFCPEGHALRLVEYAQSADGFVWRCRRTTGGKKIKTCNVKVSLRKNTFFDKSKLSIFKVIAFAYLWVKNVSQDLIIDELDLSGRTAVDWSRYCREVTFDGMVIRKEKIGGPGVVVVIGESEFGCRRYHGGHRVEGQWVFGGVERGSNRCFLLPVEKRDKETLLEIIKEWILPKTTVVSDLWKVYDCLSDEGYKHFLLTHSLHFKDPDTEQHTNTMEELWRHAKLYVSQYQRKKKFLYGYLAKFMFIKNAKASETDALLKFFQMAGYMYDPRRPITGDQGQEEEEEEDEEEEEEEEEDDS